MNGVLVLDKPAGPTSHDAVDRVRAAFGLRRVGHTGTLDPFATGVLPVCVGKATRLVRLLVAGEKAYRATVRLGFATTTDDLHGEPLAPPRTVAVSDADVRAACARLTGELMQVPPAYSAKRAGGRRLYELARRGVALAPEAARVRVHALELISVRGDRVELDVRCSTGTYVRSLARDLGAALGVGGHLVELRRTRSGEFTLGGAVAWDEIAGARERLVPMAALLAALPAVHVGDEGRRALVHGRDLDRRLVTGFPEQPHPWVRVMDGSGALVALAVPRGFEAAARGLPVEPLLHPEIVLAD